MDRLKAKREQFARRQRRVRGKVSGTAERPRLRVTRSNTHIYAQLVDDVNGKTLVSSSTVDSEVRGASPSGSTLGAAKLVGESIGKRAKEAGIGEVVFDRGGRLYHGRVKALAEGARSAGLRF